MSWWERHRGYVAVLLVNLLIMGGVVFWMRQPPLSGVEVMLPPATPTPSPTFTPAPIRVYVCGAVAHSDVYTLPAGSLVKDALNAAGGATEEADLIQINLAQVLQDQAQVYVPSKGELSPVESVVAPSSGSWSASVPTSELQQININTASREELETLPGIGPALAQRIIEHRPYHTIEDILDVPGIGPAIYEKVKDKIIVR